MSYRDFVKAKSAEMKGVPPKQRMQEISRMWNEHKASMGSAATPKKQRKQQRGGALILKPVTAFTTSMKGKGDMGMSMPPPPVAEMSAGMGMRVPEQLVEDNAPRQMRVRGSGAMNIPEELLAKQSMGGDGLVSGLVGQLAGAIFPQYANAINTVASVLPF